MLDIKSNFNESFLLSHFHSIFSKAGADAHIALSPTVGVGPYEKYYMVTIGGWDNTRSVIQEKRGGINRYNINFAYLSVFASFPLS